MIREDKKGMTFILKDRIPHVWILKIDSQKRYTKQFEKLLSHEEKAKANRLRFNKDRIASIISRGALRLLLSKYAKISNNDVRFKYGEYGKPIFINNENLKFNISHSKNLIVFGFINNLDIGIDVEYCKKGIDVMDIVDNHFSKKEISSINKTSKAKQTEAFYRGWTRKEAFIKAKAMGLSFQLDSFSVSINKDDSSELEETLWNSDEKYEWNIIPFDTLPNYKAALAIRGKSTKIDILEFDFNQIENF